MRPRGSGLQAGTRAGPREVQTVDGHTDALWESRGGAPRAPLSEASGTHGLSRGATGRSRPCSPRPGSGVSALRFAPAASRQAGSVPRARVKRRWEWRVSASDKGEEEGAGSSSIKGTAGAGVGGIADGAPLAPRLHGDHWPPPCGARPRHEARQAHPDPRGEPATGRPAACSVRGQLGRPQ